MGSRLRILFCNFEYPPLGGGGGVINALIAQELATRHDVTVLTSQGFDLPFQAVEKGVRVVRAPVFFRRKAMTASMASMLTFLPMGIRSGIKLFEENPFDVINTHFVLPTGPVGHVLSKKYGVPNVLSLHGGDLYDPSKKTSPHRHFLLRVWIRRLLKNADTVVGQSTNTLENMRRYYSNEVEGKRIPLGILRPKKESGYRGDYGLGEKEVVLVTVGRLVARKAIDQLINIMNSLRNDPFRLLIVGSGPEEAFLKKETSNRSLKDKILFLGNVDEEEKFRVLHMSDLYVSTSQHEGFGIVYLEAMACGLPVVCYNHGGQTDFLEDSVTGFLVPLNDTAQFLRRCTQLTKNNDLRRKMGQENLKRVEDYFVDHCAGQYEDIFRKVIDEARIPSKQLAIG